MTEDSRPTVHIHILSDATGLGNERLARATLVQFREHLRPVFHRHAFVTSAHELETVLDEVEAHQGVLLYTMNDADLRRRLDDAQYDRAIEFIDMLGPIMRRIGRKYKARPLLDSGLLVEALGAKELQLAQAVEFTMAHDDGRGVESYDEADVIILGVSRTSKTPTSVYLASHYCLKVANYPLVLDLDPPSEIFKLTKPHVVGLTISSEELAHVRRNRFKKGSVPNYYDPKSIRAELEWADGIFRRIRGIHVLDVTGRTVEEVSNLIIEGAAEKAIHGSEVIS
jgi:regulator of PEP synthase PpsR (kinase-PPPase family)